METKNENHILTIEKRLISILILIISISTAIFLINNIIDANMNYDSAKLSIFAYFTMQTNIIICIWLFLVAIYIISAKRIVKWCVNIHLSTAVTTYIQMTGIIFWLILVPIYIKPSGNAWLFSASNIWLHTTTPIVTLFVHNYIKALNKNDRYKLKLQYFYIYPALYVSMALYYASNGIHIYPIFNPLMLGGWLGVALGLVVLTAVFTGVYVGLLRYKEHGGLGKK